MKIAIDTQGICGINSDRGIGRFARALIKEMLELLHVEDEAVLVVNDNLSAIDVVANLKNIFLPNRSEYRVTHHRDRLRFSEKIAENIIDGIDKDIYFITNLFEGFADDSVCILSTKSINIVILYDLIPLVMRDVYLQDKTFEAWYLEKLELLKKADFILCISEHSKIDALRELGIEEDKIVTIGCDVDSIFSKQEIDETRRDSLKEKYKIKDEFIMYTGGIDKRKNIDGLIKAYSLLPQKTKEKYQLVVVCSASEGQKVEIVEYAQKLGLDSDRVIMSGYVSDEELIAFYNICSLFVFASLYEGFGMPILEAMRCGAPVIGSDNSSIKEIIELREAMFDAQNHTQISAKIEEALHDSALKEKLIENSILQSKKYSIKDSAYKSLQACKMAVLKNMKNKRADKEVREKLAYISPLPPEKTGIADYSAELLFELVKYYDVTVITDQIKVDVQRIPKEVEIKESSWFLQNRDSFLKVLYHFGNSHFHAYMFKLLEECPGVVVSHDFYISGAVGWLDRFGGVSGAYADSLYYSHGYKALLTQKNNPKNCAWEYPSNKEIIDMSVGVITHSQYQKELADSFYGDGYSKKWERVPHLRVLKNSVKRELSRAKLGIENDEFIVCSFGFMGVHKLNEKALNAFLKSALAKNKKCRLIFVGAQSGDDYCTNILKTIEHSAIKDRVYITGFVDNEKYEEYLSAMDIAVQLRTKSRGETSGTVLDAMANNRAVIINAHGTMSEYGDDICVKLEDEFNEDDLKGAFERLYEDKEYRDEKALCGYEYVKKYHEPKLIGNMYKDAIDRIYNNSWYKKHHKLTKDIRILNEEYIADDDDLKDCAVAISKNFYPPQKTQLFLDISELVKKDIKTGIQRVVRSLVSELIKNESGAYRVEPVYYKNGTYMYAREFTSSLLQVAKTQHFDCEIEYSKGDIFVGLDLSLQESIFAQERLNKMRKFGVKIYFVVYDILPVLHKEWWPDGTFGVFSNWLNNAIELSDKLICISQATKRDVERYITEYNMADNGVPAVEYFHLGADVENSISSRGITKKQLSVLNSIDFKDSFLMVGTIEPRKGHSEVLEAFEILWSYGVDVKLIIIGKQGWMVERVVERIKSSKELNKKLFFFNDASDELLERFYTKCSGLILASYGEGFGLPIIEAAKYNMPIFARDIEVFREVAGDCARYFENETVEELANEIKQWLRSDNEVIFPSSLKYLNWSESAQWLERIILD